MTWRWRAGNECKQLCLDIWQGKEQGKGPQFENLEKKENGVELKRQNYIIKFGDNGERR